MQTVRFKLTRTYRKEEGSNWSHYLEAELCAHPRSDPSDDDEKKNVIELGRQKLYVQELCNKFAEMVDRGGELELYFRDVQLGRLQMLSLDSSCSIVLAAVP